MHMKQLFPLCGKRKENIISLWNISILFLVSFYPFILKVVQNDLKVGAHNKGDKNVYEGWIFCSSLNALLL